MPPNTMPTLARCALLALALANSAHADNDDAADATHVPPGSPKHQRVQATGAGAAGPGPSPGAAEAGGARVEFNAFVAEHGKRYATAAEESRRFDVFQRNFAVIQAVS